jgi:hypothetical protein
MVMRLAKLSAESGSDPGVAAPRQLLVRAPGRLRLLEAYGGERSKVFSVDGIHWQYI